MLFTFQQSFLSVQTVMSTACNENPIFMNFFTVVVIVLNIGIFLVVARALLYYVQYD
jgi:hypothetical protein